MSNKTQLQTNNTKLDALITRVNAAKDVAASLPEAGGSGGGSSMISVTISDTAIMNGAYYFDENNIVQQVVAETKTVNALSGIVFTKTPMELIIASGNYILSNGALNAVRFLEDGGTATITM
jgi:hypothetical protein